MWRSIASTLASVAILLLALGPARAAPWAHRRGAVAFSLYPIASANIDARVGGPERIAANALLVVVSGLGGCVGPLFAAAASRRFGSDALFVTTASSGAMIASVQVYARRRWGRSRA